VRFVTALSGQKLRRVYFTSAIDFITTLTRYI